MNIKTLFCGLAFPGSLSMPCSFTCPGTSRMQKLHWLNDEFEDNFYEALKQKGIENYDKALERLQKCLGLKSRTMLLYIMR